jgi:hypothetical protein
LLEQELLATIELPDFNSRLPVPVMPGLAYATNT